MRALDHSFAALGTEVRLIAAGRAAPRLMRRAEAEIRDYECRLSRFRPDSELCALNADPRPRVAASRLLREAVSAALWAAELSGGLVDPCLLDALEAAGYRDSLADPATRTPLTPPFGLGTPANPDPAAPWRGIRVDDARGQIERPAGLRLDLGGSGKGHLADRVARVLSRSSNWVVDCGGDVRVGGTDVPREIIVAHPVSSTPAAHLSVTDRAAATSSLVGRAWIDESGRPAHHLIDPATRRPAWAGLLAATALAPTTLEAETLAKVAVLSGASDARLTLSRHGGLIVHADGAVEPIGPLPLVEVAA